ncbi:MAG: hypothetical protein LAT75_00940 [Candidatus Cyclonatronum sp.]|nr:hypothetical protein [Cyclonatronum sp.]MCH8485398.1 hypothetical protein [Cyclonatronum sp.]
MYDSASDTYKNKPLSKGRYVLHLDPNVVKLNNELVNLPGFEQVFVVQ